MLPGMNTCTQNLAAADLIVSTQEEDIFEDEGEADFRNYEGLIDSDGDDDVWDGDVS